MADQPDWTGSVNISGGTVAVTGAVSITGPITATITAGTVDVQNVAGGILLNAGDIRYVGSLTLDNNGTFTLPATIANLERALIIVLPSSMDTAYFTAVVVKSHDGLVVTKNIAVGDPASVPIGPGVVVVGYVNAGYSTAWDVAITVAGYDGNDGIAYVFADTNYALTEAGESIDDPLYVETTYPSGNDSDGQTSSPAAGVGAVAYVLGLNPATGNWDRLQARGDDVDGLSPVSIGRQIVASRGYGYDGAQWNRQRQNAAVAWLPSAARSTTQTIGSFKSYNYRGIRWAINVTAIAGSGIILPKLYAAQAGQNHDLLGAANITTPGYYEYVVYPTAGTVAAGKYVNDVLPAIYVLQVIFVSGTSVTYQSDYMLQV